MLCDGGGIPLDGGGGIELGKGGGGWTGAASGGDGRGSEAVIEGVCMLGLDFFNSFLELAWDGAVAEEELALEGAGDPVRGSVILRSDTLVFRLDIEAMRCSISSVCDEEEVSNRY